MDFFTHLIFGILINLYFFQSFTPEFIIFTALMAILPDLDVLLEGFQKVKESPLLSHKGISHSYFAALLVSIPAGLIFFLINGHSPFLSIFYAFLFYSLHVTLDGLAASKIPLFYPITQRRFRFFIDRAINPLLLIVSIIIFLLNLIFLFFSFNFPFFFYFNLITLSFYLFFFFSKILVKILIQFKLSNFQNYIPGIFPFFYYIHENFNSNEQLSFKLSKNSVFSKMNNTLITALINRGSIEYFFYKKTLDYSRKYAFFSKWEGILPLIKEDQEKITVFIFLAESYTRGRAYYLKIDYNQENREVIDVIDGFDIKINNLQIN